MEEEEYDALTRSLQRGDNQWKTLIESNIDINAQHGNGQLALIHAAARLKSTAVESVLEAKGNPDLVDAFRRTPLIHAALAAPTAMLPLIAAKANVNHRNKDGATALQALLERPYDRGEEPTITICTRKLLAAGADVHTRSPLGQSPLFFAAANHPQCVSVLLKGGANPLLRNKYGETARDEALSKQHTTAANELLEAESLPEHADTKFRMFGYIVLLLCGITLSSRSSSKCRPVKDTEEAPKHQPYIIISQHKRLVQKVHAGSGDNANPFFQRIDLYCKDLDVSAPLQFDLQATGSFRTESLGSFTLTLEQFRGRERLDGTEIPLMGKNFTLLHSPKVKVLASRLRYSFEPFEKTEGAS